MGLNHSPTNEKLEDLVTHGSFREDLFYRINVVPIHAPPLRDRKEDVPLLAQTFIDGIAARSSQDYRNKSGCRKDR